MTIIDRSEDGLVLESLPDGSYAWLRPETPIEIEPIEIKEATPADLLATPARFAAWLNAQPADASVGVAQASASCPIATFLKNEGFCGVSVGNTALMWGWGQNTGGMAHEAYLPDWAGRFTELIDDDDSRRPVRASHARALLHQACREAGLS